MEFKQKTKCPFCRGIAKLQKTTMNLFDGAVKVKGDLTYKCGKCKEEFSTGKMVERSTKLLEAQFHFNRQLISTGGSLAVTLPPDLTEYCGLEKGKTVKLIPKSKKEISIIVE